MVVMMRGVKRFVVPSIMVETPAWSLGEPRKAKSAGARPLLAWTKGRQVGRISVSK